MKRAVVLLGLALLAAGPAGTASALFLASLDAVTSWRESHRWIIAGLPVLGFLVGWIYLRWGAGVEGGTPLILEEIGESTRPLPLRMAPMILLGTLLSHLGGASVGREGTAVQMGGALADPWSRLFRLRGEDRGVLLMAGLAAGFASVFGTPLAGAVFALEVAAPRRFRADAILPCFAAAFAADQVTRAWGVGHTLWPSTSPVLSVAGAASALAAGLLCGIAALLFVLAREGIGRLFASRIAYAPLRPLLGGAAIALAFWALGSTRYAGLGIPAMLEAFEGRALPWDFAAKLAFTALALGAGFKGGEVTPLFFMGAALGASTSSLLSLPAGAAAALGFAAVFAGASRAPVAAWLMAMELFGPGIALPAALACGASGLLAWGAGRWRSRPLAPAGGSR